MDITRFHFLNDDWYRLTVHASNFTGHFLTVNCPLSNFFVNYKYYIKENVILRENGDIVNDAESVAEIFKEYFTKTASDIGFNYPIPDDYDNDDVLIYLIAKYDKHPSITAIKSVPLEHGTFELKHVDINQVYEILVNVNDKKATGWWYPMQTFENRCLPTYKNTMQTDQHVHFGMYIPWHVEICWDLCSFKKNRTVM